MKETRNSLVRRERRFRDFDVPLSGRLFRQTQEGFDTALTIAIRERQRAAVRFRNLATERETNAGTAGLGGEKRHE
jgi:hypothetical protein